MSGNDNHVTKERHKWTKAERQYVKGIVHNYLLQRWTDQDMVHYLHEDKKIKIARSTNNINLIILSNTIDFSNNF